MIKHSKKPCGCTIIKGSGRDTFFGTLQGLCDKCRKQSTKK